MEVGKEVFSISNVDRRTSQEPRTPPPPFLGFLAACCQMEVKKIFNLTNGSSVKLRNQSGHSTSVSFQGKGEAGPGVPSRTQVFATMGAVMGTFSSLQTKQRRPSKVSGASALLMLWAHLEYDFRHLSIGIGTDNWSNKRKGGLDTCCVPEAVPSVDKITAKEK
ncbi:hypothetical protein STEG23_008885 [Scotinomys teguina]